MQKLAIGLVAAALIVGMTGCKSKKPETIDPGFDDGSTRSSSQDDSSMRDSTGSIALEDIDISSLRFEPNVNLQRIYFDYDSDVLRSDAQATLRENYSYMQQNPQLVVLVEGHCDERGTQEYNLALGERRALAAREYLVRLGANPRQITTVTYGEEAPIASGHSESAWSQNRRGEFKTAPRP